MSLISQLSGCPVYFNTPLLQVHYCQHACSCQFSYLVFPKGWRHGYCHGISIQAKYQNWYLFLAGSWIFKMFFLVFFSFLFGFYYLEGEITCFVTRMLKLLIMGWVNPSKRGGLIWKKEEKCTQKYCRLPLNLFVGIQPKKSKISAGTPTNSMSVIKVTDRAPDKFNPFKPYLKTI